MRTFLATALMMTLAATGWTADRAREMKPGTEGPGGRMAAWLDLTPDQSAKIKTLMEQNRKAMRDLRDKRQDAMRALRNLVEDKGTDAQIAAKLNDLKAAQEAVQAAQKRHRDEMAKILTPTQQAKFVLGMAKRGHPGMGPGGRAGRRGWGGEEGHGHQARGDDPDDDDDE